MYTPWGHPHTIETIVEDHVWKLHTPSHGGYRLSNDYLAKMPEQLRQCSFTNDRWFEEDASWCAVPLAFPELFDQTVIDAAHKTYVSMYQNEYGEFPCPVKSI